MPEAVPSTLAKRWYMRLSLRSLLVVFLLLSIFFAWFANWRAARLREHVAARRLEAHGGTVGYGRPPLVRMAFGIEDFQKTKKSPVAALPAEYFVVVDTYRNAEFNPARNRIIDCAPINDDLVELLLELPHLESLSLEGRTPLTTDLSRLRALPQLRWLSLDCLATDADAAHFLTQRKLKGLRLGGPAITTRTLVLLEANPQLEELYLESTSITDLGLADVAKLTLLKRLSLRGSPITSAGLKQLISMQNLETLQLAGTLVDDEALPTLLQMPNLKLIEVQGTAISVEGTQQLKAASSFRTVQ